MMIRLSRPSDAKRPFTVRRAATRGPRRHAARVLVVGEDAAIAEVISDRIRGHYACEFATDVPAALAAAEHGSVGAVVYFGIGEQPHQDFGLLRSLTARQEEAAILVVSEIADPATAERAFDAGADDYLLLPLARRQLEISLSSRLAQHDLEHVQQPSPQGWIEATMERAPLMIFLKDRLGRYTFANRETHRCLGLAPGKVVGRTDADLMPTVNAAAARGEDLRVIDRGEVVEGEWTMRDADGAERTFLVSKLPFTDAEGAGAGIFGMATDVSVYKASEAVDRLTRALSWRDRDSGDHVSRMAIVTAYLGGLVGLEPEKVHLLQAAAPMHDVGKIGVPDEILRKPGRLDAKERAVMERHVRIGFKILDGSSSEVMRLAATIALTHHERWDGDGYPRGLLGTEIPIEGRLAAVADVFDALLSERPYRDALSPREVRRVIADGRGSHFDPVVTDALLDNFGGALMLRNVEHQIADAMVALRS